MPGLKRGIYNGIKSGFGHSRMRNGFAGGIKATNAYTYKMIDPTLVTGNDAPLLLWHADTCTYNPATFAVTALADLTPNGRNATVQATNTFVPKGFNNIRGYISTSVGGGFNYNNIIAGRSEFTIIMVVKSSPIVNRRLFSIENSVGTSMGDLWIFNKLAPFRLTSTQIGSPTGNTIVYDSIGALVENNWCLVTAKYRLSSPGGYSNSMNLSINGNSLVDTIASSVTYTANATYGSGVLRVCNNNALTTGGALFGSIVVFPYWLNEPDQILYENYFRTYYGYNF
jgi:hypothetical protein